MRFFLVEEIEKQLKEDKLTQAQRNGLNILTGAI